MGTGLREKGGIRDGSWRGRGGGGKGVLKLVNGKGFLLAGYLG